MHKEAFDSLVSEELYQVFLFSCPATFPFSLGYHPWIVINRKGKIARYEILQRVNKSQKNLGHLHLDLLPPYLGINCLPLSREVRWNSNLLSKIEGEENSTAFKIGLFMENIVDLYPYRETYHVLPGPNSNTFIQWIIDKFPKSGFKLSWRAIGKNYKPQ
ncbi:MAG TPA: DUF3750 domain-containing protein [Candidatus Nanoarchaeia archaeon]|nr:DUF3750 domain-containing protein [Candidatus Nanoarchaeia archaeon]